TEYRDRRVADCGDRELAQRHMAGRQRGRIPVRQPRAERRRAADPDANGRPQRLDFPRDFDPTRATNVDLQKLENLVPVHRNARALHPVGTAFDNRLPQTLANGTVRLTSITDTVNPNARAFLLGPRAWNTDISVFKNFRLSEWTQLRFTAD